MFSLVNPIDNPLFTSRGISLPPQASGEARFYLRRPISCGDH